VFYITYIINAYVLCLRWNGWSSQLIDRAFDEREEKTRERRGEGCYAASSCISYILLLYSIAVVEGVGHHGSGSW